MNNNLQYRVALLGNPVEVDTRFDDSQLDALVRLGFNTVQLNIAWGSRPPGEPLNLEDLLSAPGDEPEAIQAKAATLAEIRRRGAAAHAHGLRTLFHFGSPHVKNLYAMLGAGLGKYQAVEACILKEETRTRCREQVAAFADACPEADDILVYTYDQEAWLCSEFGECPRCKGVPLHERLPQFLNLLCEAWAQKRPHGRMWWEPWELSAGQIYKIVPQLPVQGFGLMLHSNIAEVQATRPADVWLRNMGRMAAARGIPVVAECFLASATEEILPLQHIAAPRLVFDQLAAVRALPGIVGVKEYFGLLPDKPDANLAMAGVVFQDEAVTVDDALTRLASAYAPAQETVLKAWEAAANGMGLFPWDASWLLRSLAHRSPFHDWNPFYLGGMVADSPSWLSTRRGLFMTTANEHLHPWFYEDFGLRCEAAADSFDSAHAAYQEALPQLSADRHDEARHLVEDMDKLRRVAHGLHLHCMETLAAAHLRDALGAEGAQLQSPAVQAFVRRLHDLLARDVENQQGLAPDAEHATAAQMSARFDGDPVAWVEANLRPV